MGVRRFIRTKRKATRQPAAAHNPYPTDFCRNIDIVFHPCYNGVNVQIYTLYIIYAIYA